MTNSRSLAPPTPPDTVESAPPTPLTLRTRLKRFLLLLLRCVGATWLLLLVMHYQLPHVQQGGLLHPVERFVQATALDVDAFTIHLQATVREPVESGLAGLKSLLEGVKEQVKRLSGAPQSWELYADTGHGYEVVWYEGRSATGTHWVLTAYRNGESSARLALRREERHFVAGVRESVLTLRKQVALGAGAPLAWDEPRLIVSGRTAAVAAQAPEGELARLAEEVLGGEVRRLLQNGSTSEAAVFTPYLSVDPSAPLPGANFYVHVMREGSGTRLTLGTPTLSGIETEMIASSSGMY